MARNYRPVKPATVGTSHMSRARRVVKIRWAANPVPAEPGRPKRRPASPTPPCPRRRPSECEASCPRRPRRTARWSVVKSPGGHSPGPGARYRQAPHQRLLVFAAVGQAVIRGLRHRQLLNHTDSRPAGVHRKPVRERLLHLATPMPADHEDGYRKAPGKTSTPPRSRAGACSSRGSTMEVAGCQDARRCALEGWADSLRREVQPRGVRVAIIEAGYFTSALETKQRPVDDIVNDIYPLEAALHAAMTRSSDAMAGRASASPQRMSEAMVDATEATRPRPRRIVGSGARTIWTIGCLPDQLQDLIFRTALPPPRSTRTNHPPANQPGPNTRSGVTRHEEQLKINLVSLEASGAFTVVGIGDHLVAPACQARSWRVMW